MILILICECDLIAPLLRDQRLFLAISLPIFANFISTKNITILLELLT